MMKMIIIATQTDPPFIYTKKEREKTKKFNNISQHIKLPTSFFPDQFIYLSQKKINDFPVLNLIKLQFYFHTFSRFSRVHLIHSI